MKYQKKPIVIEAFQYDGDLKDADGNYYVPDWAVEAYKKGIMYYETLNENKPPCELFITPCQLFINTLEGIHHVSIGDYVIQGVQGELYPCKPDIFEASYENSYKNNCKIIISHNFNSNYNNESTISVGLITTKEIKNIAYIHGKNSEGILDLTSILLEHGYKIVKQD